MAALLRLAGYVTMTSTTFDKQSNDSRKPSNCSWNHLIIS